MSVATLACSSHVLVGRQQQPRQRAAALHSRSAGALNRPQRCREAVGPAVARASPAEADPTTAPAEGAWASFAAAASGEWDGVSVSFDSDGDLKQLPEYYVPQAFRDWNVELYDWQSQCSVRADSEGMSLTHRKMMPTVGCEADAVAFTEEAQLLFAPGTPGASFAADGAYTQGPAELAGLDNAAFEHCLPVEAGRRVRVVHHLKRLGREARWRLMEVELHWEQFDQPYCGRVELQGCGGGVDPISQAPRLAPEALGGSWAASGVQHTCSGSGEWSSAAVTQQAWSAVALPSPVLNLPKGTWAACSVDGESVSLAAGVVLEDGSMRLASSRVEAGRRCDASLLTLARA